MSLKELKIIGDFDPKSLLTFDSNDAEEEKMMKKFPLSGCSPALKKFGIQNDDNFTKKTELHKQRMSVNQSPISNPKYLSENSQYFLIL